MRPKQYVRLSIHFAEHRKIDRRFMAYHAETTFGSIENRSSAAEVLASGWLFAANASLFAGRIEIGVLAVS